MSLATDLFIPGPAGLLEVRTKGLEGRPAKVVILIQGANLSGQLGYDFAFGGRNEIYPVLGAWADRLFNGVRSYGQHALVPKWT